MARSRAKRGGGNGGAKKRDVFGNVVYTQHGNCRKPVYLAAERKYPSPLRAVARERARMMFRTGMEATILHDNFKREEWMKRRGIAA